MASKDHVYAETTPPTLALIPSASRNDLPKDGHSIDSLESMFAGFNTSLSSDSALPQSGCNESPSSQLAISEEAFELRPPRCQKPRSPNRRAYYEQTKSAALDTSPHRRAYSEQTNCAALDTSSCNICMNDVHDAIKMVAPEAALACFSNTPDTTILNLMETSKDEFCELKSNSTIFLLVEGSESCFRAAVYVLNHYSSSVAGIVIPVLMEQLGITNCADMSRKISALVESGADDVIALPATIPDLSVIISASLAKGKAQRRLRLGSLQRLRLAHKRCDRLFWQVAHEIMPDFPEEQLNMPEVPGKRFANMALGRKLGEGAFGTVYRCQNTETGESCVVKVFPKASIKSHSELQHIVTEYAVLTRVSHPNIVSGFNFIHAVHNLYILMEMAGPSNLYKKLRVEGERGMPWATVKNLISQISVGVAHLHEQQIAHCDLKPANLILSFQGCIKLADFGQAVDLSEGVPKLSAPIGTMPFVPPEVLYVSPKWDPIACDLWQLGVILFELLCGNGSFAQLMGWVGRDLMSFVHSSECAKQCAKELMACFDANARGSTLAIVPQMSKVRPPSVAIELLADLLEVTPEMRLPAKCMAPRLEYGTTP